MLKCQHHNGEEAGCWNIGSSVGPSEAAQSMFFVLFTEPRGQGLGHSRVQRKGWSLGVTS